MRLAEHSLFVAFTVIALIGTLGHMNIIKKQFSATYSVALAKKRSYRTTSYNSATISLKGQHFCIRHGGHDVVLVD